MCIPYMHEKAESMSNLVMETSPNIVLIVGPDMRILEYSDVGEKYLEGRAQRRLRCICMNLLIRWISSGYSTPIRISMESGSAIRSTIVHTPEHCIHRKGKCSACYLY